jgi:hypothetical protein
MPKRSSIQQDMNVAAFNIMKRTIGSGSPLVTKKRKNPAAVALGRLGGLVGGKARAKALSAEQRRSIAQKAATRRWEKE